MTRIKKTAKIHKGSKKYLSENCLRATRVTIIGEITGTPSIILWKYTYFWNDYFVPACFSYKFTYHKLHKSLG